MSKRVKAFLARLILFFGVLGFGVLVIELSMGNWFGKDLLYGLNLPRNVDLQYDVNGFYELDAGEITYTRDENGFRGAFDSAAEIDILTVGGSTTDQRYLDDEATWQACLRRNFAEDGYRVAVGNAGIDGHSSVGHIRACQSWFPLVEGLNPRVIMFYVGLNDVYIKNSGLYDGLVSDDKKTLKMEIEDRSAILRLGKMLQSTFQARVKHKIVHRKIDFSKVGWVESGRMPGYDSPELLTQRTDFGKRIRTLISLTREMQAEPVMVTQATCRYRKQPELAGADVPVQLGSFADANGVDYYEVYSRMNGELKRVCEEEGVVVLDLADERDWASSLFYDFEHMVPAGAQVVGDDLYRLWKGSPSFEALVKGVDRE